jgi:leucyl aminopeptidase (aminopeptidase T)
MDAGPNLMAPNNSSLESLYGQVARKVLGESLSVKKGESLVVETWNNGLPFARHVVVEARRIGAVPITLFEDEEAYIEGVRKGDADSVGVMGKHEQAMLSSSDAYVFIPGPPIGALSRKLERKEVADSTRYNQSWYEAAAKAKLRGARLPFGYVDEDIARALGKSVRAIVTHQLRGALTDFGALGARARAIAPQLRDGATVKLATPRALLAFTLNGESEISDGVVDQEDIATENNVAYIPPGYVYKQVDPSSASGTLSLSPLLSLYGPVKDALLEFERGKLTRWSSRSSQNTLNKIVEATAEQSRVAGGLLIGLNPDLKYGYGQNTLVGGVVAIRCAGVTATTKDGTLTSDGKTIVAKGRIR